MRIATSKPFRALRSFSSFGESGKSYTKVERRYFSGATTALEPDFDVGFPFTTLRRIKPACAVATMRGRLALEEDALNLDRRHPKRLVIEVDEDKQSIEQSMLPGGKTNL